MNRWARFVDWCQQPSKIKIRTFNPRNAVVLATISIILVSSIIFGAWRYLVASAPQITVPEYTFVDPESFENLTITTDTTLTEDFFGQIIIEADGITLNGDGHMIIGPGSSNVLIGDPRIKWAFTIGILLEERTGVTVKNCRVTGFGDGIYLYDSDGNTLLNNTANDNVFTGFVLSSSSNNILLNNTANNIIDYGTGFVVEMSCGNTFKGNTANNNTRGFSLSDGCSGNVFETNTAKSNMESGFMLLYTSTNNNIFFHNNLIGNTVQVTVSPGCANTWDNGYPSGGNYWSDYEGVDADGDGIGDTPYLICTFSYEFGEEDEPAVQPPVLVLGEPDGNNVDRFPLMAPING
jgi:parallel beta-helix repeat protein